VLAFGGSEEHSSCRLLKAEGVRFESIHLPRGVAIANDGSMTMVNCTSTGDRLHVGYDASLVMEDYCIFGSSDSGIYCDGKLDATRCIFEENTRRGVRRRRAGQSQVGGLRGAQQLGRRVRVQPGQMTLVGGTISGNKRDGVDAINCGTVTVAAAEHSEKRDRPQTVSTGNGENN